jgi:SAM-dependent methyltransferase
MKSKVRSIVVTIDTKDLPHDDRCPMCGALGFFEPALQKDGYDIMRCTACGVGHAVVGAFNPDCLYNSDYFTGKVRHAYVNYAGSEKVLRHEFQRQVGFLRKFVQRGKLLEIGCAYGFFLQQAKLFFDVYGVEVSAEAVEFCHATGLPNVWRAPSNGDLFQEIGELDAIVLLDVIEHIDDVVGTMKLALERLRPHGVILITTGDWDSLLARLTGASWRLIAPPYHLWYFTRKSLGKMLAQFDCKEEHFSHPWKFVPLELIIDQLGTMVGRQLILPSLFSRGGVPANLYDAMRVVYRKQAF